MAKPNGRGGWDLTDDDVADIIAVNWGGADTLWWLSFVDPARSAPIEEQVPGGGGFLGVAVVEASSFIEAVDRAHRLGINPGGQVQGLGPIPASEIGVEWRHRLLTAAEVDAMPDPEPSPSPSESTP